MIPHATARVAARRVLLFRDAADAFAAGYNVERGKRWSNGFAVPRDDSPIGAERDYELAGDGQPSEWVRGDRHLAKATMPAADLEALWRLPPDARAALIYAYGSTHPEAQRDPRLRKAMVDAEDHLLGHGDEPLAKAAKMLGEQLGLFDRKRVQRPGIRGGKWRVTPEGEIRYDEPPKPKLPKPPAEIEFHGGQPTEPGERRPLPDSPLVVSYGGGWDSTAILIEMARRGIIPDGITFADTGGEWRETYDFMWTFNQWLLDHGMPTITIVRREPTPEAPYSTLEENSIANQTPPGVLLGQKNCSIKWKQEPQWKWLRQQPWAQAAWAAGKPVVRAIGYEAGEEYRSESQGAMKGSPGEAQWHPLQEWGITREECGKIIVAAGLKLWPAPGGVKKSACFFCPASKREECLELARLHPDLAARAVSVENVMLGGIHPVRAVEGLSWDYNWNDLIGHDPKVKAELAKMPPEQRFGEVIQFGSGGSAPAQFAAFVEAHVPVGIDISVASADLWRDVADYLQDGGRVFVDSGAFSFFRGQLKKFLKGKGIDEKAFKHLSAEQKGRLMGEFDQWRKTQPPMDWPDVMARYKGLLDTVVLNGKDEDARWRLRHLYLVMPDVVGDQDATLALQEQYAEQMRAWGRGDIDPLDKPSEGNGVRLLVPIQLGKLKPSECYYEIARMLSGTRGRKGFYPKINEDFVVLVPSNEKAFSSADLADLLKARPKAIHLAGIAANPRVAKFIAQIRAAEPGCAITTDANRIAAWSGEGRPLTEALKQSRDVQQPVALDYVRKHRVLEDPLMWLSTNVTAFAKAMKQSPKDVSRALAGGPEGFRRYLDAMREVVGDDAVWAGLARAFQRELNVGPEWQTRELAKLLRERGVGPAGMNLRAVRPADEEEPVAKGGDVLHPGARGGKFYRTKSGKVRYGDPPAAAVAAQLCPSCRHPMSWHDSKVLNGARRFGRCGRLDCPCSRPDIDDPALSKWEPSIPVEKPPPGPSLFDLRLREIHRIEDALGEDQDYFERIRHFRGKIDGRDLNEGHRVSIDLDPLCVRAAGVVADVLEEMRAKGYRMPGEVLVARYSGAAPKGETMKVRGGIATDDTILTVRLPEELPPDAHLDDAIAWVFGGQTGMVSVAGTGAAAVEIAHAQMIDRFTVRSTRDIVLHEMGHCLDTSGLRDKPTIPPHYYEAAALVSDYATTDRDEFIAESFVRLYRGETLAPASLALYRTWKGPEVK